MSTSAIQSSSAVNPQSISQKNSKKGCFYSNNKFVAALDLLISYLPAVALIKAGERLKQPKIENCGRRFYAIHITHNAFTLNSGLGPDVLCRTRNIAQREVIQAGTDVTKSNELIEKVKSQLPPTFEIPKIKNALTDGICFGGSIEAIHSLSKSSIQTEEQLINHIRSNYQDGFTEEAAALQYLLEPWVQPGINDQEKMALDLEEDKKTLEKFETEQNAKIEKLVSEKKVLVNKKKELEEKGKKIQGRLIKTKKDKQFLKDLPTQLPKIEKDIGTKESEIEKLHNQITTQRQLSEEMQKQAKKIADPEQSIYSMVGLNRSIEKDSTEEHFNNLKNGHYQLHLVEAEHAVAYIKTGFGSYLLDPNFGLIKCDKNSPAQTVSDLVKKYYKKDDPFAGNDRLVINKVWKVN